MITRRQFIVAGGAGLAGVTLGGGAWWWRVEHARQALIGHACALFERPDAARRVGNLYLAVLDPAPAPGRLAKELFGPDISASARLSAVRLRERLQRAMQADFAGDRTVELEGWVLSRTEARLCALLALAPP